MKRLLLALLVVACDPSKAATEGLNKAAAVQLADIHAQVAADAVAQYEMAKRNNASPIEICTHAGMVSAAFLQAKDEPSYAKWQAIQKSDCKAAGLPE